MSDFTGYWRRVQRSFLDFVGSGTIRGVLNLDLFSASSYSKHLALPTPGVVFIIIRSKTGFVEWHIARGGWVSYAYDFPISWSVYDLIVGFYLGVTIKKGVVEEIDAATPVGNGKEKKIKKETGKKSEVEESVGCTEVGQGTKRRKIASTCKQLTISEDLGKWTPLLLERRSAILPSQRSE